MSSSSSIAGGEGGGGAPLPPHPAAYGGPRDGVIKEGWLSKQSKFLKDWRRRWFVLTPQCLCSYKTSDVRSQKPTEVSPTCLSVTAVSSSVLAAAALEAGRAGRPGQLRAPPVFAARLYSRLMLLLLLLLLLQVLYLRDCSTVKSADDEINKENAFRVDTPKRVFFLLADSSQEKESWIGHIGRQMRLLARVQQQRLFPAAAAKHP
ncbi:hypothetical protein Efla_006743 [Eimeria flavescens]